MRSGDLSEIRKLDLFKDMGDDSYDTLMRGAYVQNFPPQVELITEGEFCDFLYILVDGSVELLGEWNDTESTMAIIQPVSTFILAAAVKDAPCLMSARTLEKSRLVFLPSTDVRAGIEADNAFARAVVDDLAKCYRGVIKNSKGLKLRTSLERLANYLLKHQRKSGGGAKFQLTIEKRRLASYLGMTPENLSRAIKSLRPYGVLIDGARVEIADNTDLKTLAKPTPLIDDSQM